MKFFVILRCKKVVSSALKIKPSHSYNKHELLFYVQYLCKKKKNKSNPYTYLSGGVVRSAVHRGRSWTETTCAAQSVWISHPNTSASPQTAHAVSLADWTTSQPALVGREWVAERRNDIACPSACVSSCFEYSGDQDFFLFIFIL